MTAQPGTLNIKIGETEQLILKYEKVAKSNGESSTRRYAQSRLLGRGGFAKVYQFTCLETQEVYAAKVIAKSSLKEEIYMQKFKAEIKLHKSLNHPNIVRFDRYFDDQENVYILLELCPNDSLSQLLVRRKRLTEIEVQYYISQIVQALKYIHDQKILHRDLKLANLLLNDKMQVKVADFGLAAKLASDTEKRKTVCGTPHFMAPEVLDNSKGYSYPADIWSLGVITFNLLTGKLPFEALTSKEIYNKVQEGKYTFPPTLSLSPAAKDIINKMLTLDPEKRITILQIQCHPFMNPRGGIPAAMPTSTLHNPPPASLMKQVIVPNEATPKLSALFRKVEATKEKKDLRYKSVEPVKTPSKSPPKKRAQERGRESQTPTPTKKKTLNKSESSIADANAETKTSFNKDNKDNAAYKTAPKPDKGLQGLKEILNEVKETRTQDNNNNAAGYVKVEELVNGEHAKKVSKANGRALSNLHNRTMEKKESADSIENKPPHDQRVKVKYSFKREDSKQISMDLKLGSAMDNNTRPGSAMDIKDEKVVKESKESNKEEKVNILKAWPIVRILYWMDYTSSYGLGYTLSDGSVGALFNDETKMILQPDGETIDYVAMELGRKEVHMKYSLTQHPGNLKEKVMDLQRFNKYFERHNQKTTKETGRSQSNGLMYVKKWLKTKHAALFRMNNQDLQVVFIDNSMLTMNSDGKKIMFISKKGEIKSYNLEVQGLSKDSEVKKRMTYTMEVLEKIWAKKHEENSKKKGEKAELDWKFCDERV